MLVDGKIKGIRTKSKAEDEGNVLHLTTISLEFEDLDRSVIDQLALAEYIGRYLTVDMEAYKPASRRTQEGATP